MANSSRGGILTTCAVFFALLALISSNLFTSTRTRALCFFGVKTPNS
jgi:hypothetical protein